MLKYLQGILGGREQPESRAAARRRDSAPEEVVVDGAPSFALRRHLIIHNGYPILHQEAVGRWIDTVPEPIRQRAWEACERAWLLHFRDALGPVFHYDESATAALLSSLESHVARATLEYMERTLKRIVAVLEELGNVPEWGKDLLIVFDDQQQYYDYVSFYYPDSGEFAFSGGMYISRGAGHFVTVKEDLRGIEPTIAHEMTHACLSHLPLPLWLNEGIAVNTESRLVRLPHRLATPQIKRHALPTPVVDPQLYHGKRGRVRAWLNALALRVAPILSPQRVALDRVARQRPNGLQDLYLFAAHGRRFVSHRCFHRGDGQQLQQVVLKDVAHHAGGVVVGAAPADVHFLRDRDLHVVDIVAVPDRLEDRVGEPQHEQVLHGLFAEIMVDAINLPLVEHFVNAVIKLPRGVQIGAEGLFDHHAGAQLAVGLFARQTGGGDARGDLLRDGDVVRLDCTSDNSAEHRAEVGLDPPPVEVMWGEQTTDEMCIAFVGVTMLTPIIARPLVAGIGMLMSWTFAGKLGRLNAGRNPRRTAITASALMIAVALITGIATISVVTGIDRGIRRLSELNITLAGFDKKNKDTGEMEHVPAPAGVGELAARVERHAFSTVTDLPVLMVPGVRSGPIEVTSQLR